MDETAVFKNGSYRYIRGPFQYSGGVAAEPGFIIERARFLQAISIKHGFEAIEAHLTGLGRPLASFCACELRSPEPFDDAGFITFNRAYVNTLEKWGIFKNDENPVARSNVCPEVNPPPEPMFHSFSYTIPDDESAAKTFVIAGSAEAHEGDGNYGERIIRNGETTPDAMREKAKYVLNTMELRMAALGVGWDQVTATQVYTVYDIHSFLGDEIVDRGAADYGLTWYYARPPVSGLDYEMDVRGVHREKFIF